MTSIYMVAFVFSLAFIGILGLIFTDKKIEFGILEVLCFIYFNRLSLTTNYYFYDSVFIYLGGILLLSLEFLVPSFGALGITGITLALCSLNFAVDRAGGWENILIIGGIAFGTSLVFLRFALKDNIFEDRVLTTSSRQKEDVKSRKDFTYLIGREGVTSTVLRPVGKIYFDGLYLDCQAETGYLPKGAEVVVVDFLDGYLIVREKEEFDA